MASRLFDHQSSDCTENLRTFDPFDQGISQSEQGISLACRALPNGQYAPSTGYQRVNGSLIALDIACELGCPKLRTRCRQLCVFAMGVHMPKASMDKNCHFPARQNHIGSARKILPVKAKPIPRRKEHLSNKQLRARVLAPDARHHPTSNGWGYDVAHGSELQQEFTPRKLTCI